MAESADGGEPMQIGRWDVQIIDGGSFALDGGAMFGTVPKAVWGKLYPHDAENRILMTTNCLLLRGELAISNAHHCHSTRSNTTR